VSFAESELEDPAPATPAPAAAAPAAVATPAAVVPAPAANSTAGNSTFVPSNATGTWPTGPNPADPVCGCYNGATCQVGVCICASQWSGQWCERPSPIALARQAELDRLANLTAVIKKVSQQVTEIEAASGSPAAVRRLISEAARKEIIQMNVANSEREFHSALSRSDLFVARDQLNVIKFMDPEKYAILAREYAVQEDRINKEAASARPGIQVMAVPVMQTDKYKDVDLAFAKEVRMPNLERAKSLVKDAKAQAREFNLVFGDPV